MSEKPPTVLIVEDNKTESSLLAHYLKTMGHRSLAAHDGLTALSHLAAESIDVVLLDLDLPDIDGFEVLRRMRREPTLKSIPVIIVSGAEDRETIIRAMGLGANDYMIKPIDSVKLRGRIQALQKIAEPKKRKPFAWSLNLAGAKAQFGIAAVLITILPFLALMYVLLNPLKIAALSDVTTWIVIGFVLTLIGLGYVLLVKYPLNVVRLRKYLELLAKSDRPVEKISLLKNEDDLEAIESLVSTLIDQMEERINTIEKQAKDLLQAETQRVMIESLGAACHHIGQPTTVISVYLSMMEQQETDEKLRTMITECQAEVDKIADVLRRMQAISAFRREPYLPPGTADTTRPDEYILSLPKQINAD